MIKKEIQDAINRQIVREMYSSNLYLAMAGHFSSINLKGFANWMRVQAREETVHAMKFFDYLINRGGKAEVGAIGNPPSTWETPLQAFEDAYEHELLVTHWINELMDIALEHKDHASASFLKWFIDEQVEEEANTSELVERLRLNGDSKSGLFMIDNELKARVFTPPVGAPEV